MWGITDLSGTHIPIPSTLSCDFHSLLGSVISPRTCFALVLCFSWCARCLPFRSRGRGCRHSADCDTRRHGSGQANSNLRHTEGVTAVRTSHVVSSVRELSDRGRRGRDTRKKDRTIWRQTAFLATGGFFAMIPSMCCNVVPVSNSDYYDAGSEAWCAVVLKADDVTVMCGALTLRLQRRSAGCVVLELVAWQCLHDCVIMTQQSQCNRFAVLWLLLLWCNNSCLGVLLWWKCAETLDWNNARVSTYTHRR